MLFVLVCLFAGLHSCKDEGNNQINNIPDVPVNLTINLDLPSYYHLQTPGSYALLEGGFRGVFLVHHFDGNYYALERTCSFQSDLACAVIHIDTTNIQLRCGSYTTPGFETCCTSQFSFDGFVIQAPATLPLKRYRVSTSGNLVTIRN